MFGDRYYEPRTARERYLRRLDICNRQLDTCSTTREVAEAWNTAPQTVDWIRSHALFALRQTAERLTAEDAAAIDELLQRILAMRIAKVLTD